MTIFLLSDDLMTSSRVQGAASPLKIQTCSNLLALLEAIGRREVGKNEYESIAANMRPLVLLDLQTKGVDWESAIADLKPLARLLAFGPHVWKEQLELADRTGCDQVLTNGKFFADVGKWLR